MLVLICVSRFLDVLLGVVLLGVVPLVVGNEVLRKPSPGHSAGSARYEDLFRRYIRFVRMSSPIFEFFCSISATCSNMCLLFAIFSNTLSNV